MQKKYSIRDTAGRITTRCAERYVVNAQLRECLPTLKMEIAKGEVIFLPVSDSRLILLC